MILNFLFLTPVFIIGIVCSYTDVRYGKIRNKWLAIGFAWALILYAVLFIYNYFFLHQLGNVDYVKGILLNGFVAFSLGYVLWNLRLLAAGDAKLFALYALLIPPEFYAKSYFWGFPSFILLINIFIPLLLFLVFKSLLFVIGKTLKNKKRFEGGRKLFNGKWLKEVPLRLFKLSRTYMKLILMLIIVQLVLSKINLFPGGSQQSHYSAYFFIFLFFAYRFVFSFISKHKLLNFVTILAGLGAICYLVFNNQTGFLLSTIRIAIIFMIFVGVFKKLLTFYIDQEETRKVESKDLDVGTSPYFYNLDNDLKIKLGKIDQSGLVQEQVDLVREFLLNHPDREIKMYKTFALAPFMLLGVLISVLTTDSFISLLSKAFNLIF